MAEADLASYQLQLQQVEAALLADPESGELLKLKEDLCQVIDLTKELISAQDVESSAVQDEDVDNEHVPSLPEPVAAASSSYSQQTSQQEEQTPVKHWQVGEQCQALWPKDGNYWEAVVSEIHDHNEVVVTFKSNQVRVSTTLGSLRLSEHGYTGSATSLDKRGRSKAAGVPEEEKGQKGRAVEGDGGGEGSRQEQVAELFIQGLWQERFREKEHL